MMTRSAGVQQSLFSVTLEEVVPENHLLRKLDKVVDFSFIYDELAPHYCAVNGRASIDPVIIVKSILIAFLYGIHSERRLEQELDTNVAYRWFIGIPFGERVPDHSTLSQLRRRKYNNTDIFKTIFKQTVKLCAESGLISGRLLVTDSTHVRASASNSKKEHIEIEQQADLFLEELDKYEAQERERLGLPSIEHKHKPEKTERTKSITDPDAGWLKRPGKPEGFHYLSHQTMDAENGIIVDVEVTAANVRDNEPYLEQIESAETTLRELNIEVEAACGDAAYDTALIHKVMEERSLKFIAPKNEHTPYTKVEYTRNDFAYDKESDTFTCPAGKILSLKTFQRTKSNIYREYRTKPCDCKNCPNRSKCLAPSQKSRKIQVNIFQSIVDKHHENDGSDEYNEALKKRRLWCEATFGIQKQCHNLKGMFRRGLRAAREHCWLSACAINLKRFIKATT